MEQTNRRFRTRRALLMHLVSGSKRFFIGGVLAGWATSLMEMVNPQIISFTVDSVLGDAPYDLPAPVAALVEGAGGTAALRENLLWIAGAILLVAALAAAGRWGLRMLNARGQEVMLRRTRNELYQHIIRLPLSWHNENRTGDIIQRCTSDVDVIRAFLADQLVTLIRTAVMIVMALYFMIGISPRLSLVTAVFIPVTVLMSLFFHVRIQKSFRRVDEKEGELSAEAQENLTGVRVVRAFGREMFERERFEKSNEEYTGMWDRLMRLLSLFWASGDLLSGLQRVLILSVGTVLAVSARGELTTGQFIAFIAYSAMLEWPVRQLGRVISGMSRAGVSLDRILYIMNSAREADPADPETPEMTGDVAFRHVTFGYKEDERVLSDVSFTAKGGQVTGILGSTGSGKSTLMYLLCRLYDLPEGGGSITVGGHDLSRMSREWVRTHVGIVQQEPYLFSRTLRENISIARPDATEEDVREAARVAALDETVAGFTKGYETFVGERGVTLSGGQKQRAAIAQTLLCGRPVLLLDDSLSAVDSATDMKIREALDRLDTKATRIIISHRVTTLMSADHIVVLDKGRVVEEGTHEELLARGGMYSRICALQSPEAMRTA